MHTVKYKAADLNIDYYPLLMHWNANFQSRKREKNERSVFGLNGYWKVILVQTYSTFLEIIFQGVISYEYFC